MNLTSIQSHFLAIDKILELPIVDKKEIERHLYFVSSFPILTFDIPADTYFYRSSSSFTNEYFNSISRISYNPNPDKIKNYGRANFPGQSMFYCSEDQGTSSMELVSYWVKNIKHGQFFYVTIGEWQSTEIIKSIIIVTPIIQKRKSRFEIYSGNAFDKNIENFSLEFRKISQVVYGKLSNYYSTPAKFDSNIYKVTASFSNKLINEAKKIGIFKNGSISYPSVAFADGVNFVFEPKIVENNSIKLCRTWRVMMVAKQNEKGTFAFKEVKRESGKIIEDGTIIW